MAPWKEGCGGGRRAGTEGKKVEGKDERIRERSNLLRERVEGKGEGTVKVEKSGRKEKRGGGKRRR